MSQFNTIAGWALAGGIVALGSSIVTAEMWHAERPEEMGDVGEGVAVEGGEGEEEMSIEAALNQATVEQGEAVFARCASCHTINQGGADGIGPNLYGVLGAPHGHVAGFAYSSELAGIPGNWTFQAMSDWLRRPSEYAPGTKMSFAGLSDPLDRAAVILYLNANGSNLPIPAPPADDAAEEDEAATEGEDEAIEDAENADPEAEAATEAEVGDAAGE